MYISDRPADDFPQPETIDAVARMFTVPVMSFIPQPALEELAIPATTASSFNGGAMSLDSLAISYTLWRNPRDRDDPTNLANLSDLHRAALDAAPVRPLPSWMIQQREMMRYPMLWEAVMTTRVSDDDGQAPESTLTSMSMPSVPH